MNLFKIAWRSLQQRSLASTLTGLSMALGVALVVTVLVIHGAVDRQFSGDAQGYHLIVGAKGGKLQLVLNTVFHLSQPIENIPYSYYEEFVDGQFAEQTKLAVPFCLGDSYRANDQTYRVVGTTTDMFDKLIYGRDENGVDRRYEFADGRNFKADHFFEAVIGSVVARQSGLKVGDQFNPTHNIVEDDDGHKHDAFTVVGILAPTGTANDRALFVNMEGFLLLDGHAKEAPADEPVNDEGEVHDHDHPAPSATDTHSDDENREADEHAHEDEGDADHDKHDSQGEHHHADHADEAEHAHEGETDANEAHADDAHDHDAHADADESSDETGAHEQDAHAHEAHTEDAHADDAHDQHDHAHAGHAHGDHAHTPLPKSQREVTAVLVVLEGGYYYDSVFNTVNEGQIAQAVSPTREVTLLLETMVAPIQWILLVLTILIVAVASISILVGIYNSMSERSHDIAVMRALGASRSAVMCIILLESILLALCGGAVGLLLGHTLVALANPFAVAYAGVELGFAKFDLLELVLIPGLVILAAIVGLLPAVAAYQTDVAKSLSRSP